MNEIICTGLFAGLIKHVFEVRLTVGTGIETIKDVRPDITREQYWLLLDDRNLLVIPLRVYLVDIYTVESDLTLFWLIELFDKGNYGTFTTTRCADKSDDFLALIHFEFDISQNLDIVVLRV